ncbi:MAG: tetratricopeptide repeat protein [Sandaracinus sp.]|nr:tetratricopeptide repeat protein [Sandaracinus sp.]
MRVVMLGLWLLAAVPVAFAQDANETLLTTGDGLLREGEATAARALLRRAHEAAPSAQSAGLLGLAELAAGDPIAADGLLRSLPADDAWVRREQARISEALAQIDRQVGVVALRGAPTGREVHVEENGTSRLVGVTPVLPFRVRPGRVVVRIEEQRRDLAVAAGGRVEVDFGSVETANPFPEGPAEFTNPADTPFPSGPATDEAAPLPPADAVSFGPPDDATTLPASMATRYARGSVEDVPVRRSEWRRTDRVRRVAVGFTGRVVPDYAQVYHAFDMRSCCLASRAVLVPHVTGRWSLHPRFAVVGRLAAALVINGAGEDYSSSSTSVPGGRLETDDEWSRVFGFELDAYGELDLARVFVDVGVRFRLWFARSSQVVRFQAFAGPNQGDSGEVLQIGPTVGAVLRPGVWLDRHQRVRVAAELAAGKDLLEFGGGLEVFFF